MKFGKKTTRSIEFLEEPSIVKINRDSIIYHIANIIMFNSKGNKIYIPYMRKYITNTNNKYN